MNHKDTEHKGLEGKELGFHDYEDSIVKSDMLEEEEREAGRFAREMKDVEIPESLLPEQIEKKFSAEKRKRRSRLVKYGSAAACAVIVLGAAAGIWRLSSTEGNETEGGDTSGSIADTQIETAQPELQTAESYDEIYDYIAAVWEESNASDRGKESDWFMVEESMDMAAEDSGATTGGTGGGYSDTNTREESVGEADIVKTDGNFIYLLNGRKIQIVDIRSRDMKEVGKILLEGEIYASEMYVKDGKLIVFYSQSEQVDKDSDEYGAGYREYAVAETFDVSDPSNPKSIGRIRQSGSYDSVRISDGYVYLFSTYTADWGTQAEPREAYIPEVQGKLLDSDAVYLPQISKGNRFLLISSFSLENPDKTVDSKAILSSGGNCYVSPENIYIYEAVYDQKEKYNQTSIRKISYHKGELKGVAQTKIWGYIKDSFCIDEYEGNLRVVTTVDPIVNYGEDSFILFDSTSDTVYEATTNALYVLDKKLNVSGKIEKLAPDEEVYSARFMGETGYFVTYEQIDPLFSVDLSDPEDPKIIGALKIPGFSEYLHPYGDGQLLGIGMDADMSGVTNGVKLSMFDISDPEDVQEVRKEVLEECYSTDVFYDYKAVLADSGKNLIGFSAYGNNGMYYYLYSYDPEAGFTRLLEKEITGYSNNIRGLYSGDILYLVEGNAIESFDLRTFEKVDDIVL